MVPVSATDRLFVGGRLRESTCKLAGTAGTVAVLIILLFVWLDSTMSLI